LEYPSNWKKQFITKNGQNILFRPVQPSDTEMLWRMFHTLSEKSLSNLIPPFTREMIEDWTSNIDYNKILAIVAVTQDDQEEKIVADASLRFNPQEILKHKAELAIAVHDDYQHIGIGSALIEHLLKIARNKKLTKIWLNVRSTNKKAMHVYEKAGFKIEAKLSKECYIKGKYEDDYRMAIFL
jgi:ribosomal protein S18 acetylase RimI-like enzyme